MKTVYLNQRPVYLQKEIGGGQEAIVYDIGNRTAAKVYRSPDDSLYKGKPSEQKGAKIRLRTQQQKLKSYPSGLTNHVVTPRDLLYNRQGALVGYTMPLIEHAIPLHTFSNRTFREQQGIDNNQMVALLKQIHQTIQEVHQTGTVIGDLNDMNIIVQDKDAYFIDTDSWQFAGYPCTMYTERFVDPSLCSTSQVSGRTTLEMKRPHSKLSDWYAFHVIAFKTLLFVDPYGGIYRPKDKRKKISEHLRPAKRVTVFHPEVKYPKPALGLEHLPDRLREYFKQVFTKDLREVFPKDLLNMLYWSTCQSCGVTHARQDCPNCSKPTPVQHLPTEHKRGNVVADTVFSTPGIVLATDWQDGKLVWLYHEHDEFKRENKQTVKEGPLKKAMRYRIWGSKTLFGGTYHTVKVVTPQGGEHQIEIDTVGSLPIFDTTDKYLYWIADGSLYRNNPLGIQYEHNKVGDALKDQTLIWAGKGWGFGIWRTHGMTQGFTFNDTHRLLNDSVTLPPLKGSIIDAVTHFSSQYAWFLCTLREGSRLINYCIVIDTSGNICYTTQQDNGADHWLGTIRYKGAAGKFLFCATDQGIVRVEITHQQLRTTHYPDTEPFVDAQSTLHITPKGIYVQQHNSIRLLRIRED